MLKGTDEVVSTYSTYDGRREYHVFSLNGNGWGYGSGYGDGSGHGDSNWGDGFGDGCKDRCGTTLLALFNPCAPDDLVATIVYARILK